MDNNIIKRAFTLMLSMVAVSAPFAYNKANSNSIIESAYAESGESDHIKWSLEKGVLKISGSGAMSTSSLSIPWKENVNDITTLVIDSGITSVGSFAFRNCGNLVSVTLPDTITVIERNAFKGCSSLTSINFPVGIKSIERSVFSECSALTEVSFPNTLVSIGESAFEECASLNKAIIPDIVNTIEDYAFENCNSDLLICCSFGSAAFSYVKANGHKYDDSYTFEKNPVEPTDPVNGDTFIITSGKDFKKLPDISSDYKIISLEADISAPLDWTSIAGFNGTFNGNGHKISGLTNSLFATLGKDAVVKNLTFSDVQIDISTGGSPVGGIASENMGTIKNCSVTGEINYMSALRMNEKITWINSAVFPNTFRYFCAGGIAGINSSTIEDCTNSAKIYINNSSSWQAELLRKTTDLSIIAQILAAYTQT